MQLLPTWKMILVRSSGATHVFASPPAAPPASSSCQEASRVCVAH